MGLFSKIKELFTNAKKNTHGSGNWAVILAAGSSLRMEGISKIFAEINDMPVIIRSAMAFEQCDKIEKIIIVARQEDIADISTLCRENYIHKLSKIVAGGDSREKSVLAGLLELPSDCALVAIHDGARPLIEPDNIEEVFAQAELCSGALLGVPVKDTVKEVSRDGFVVATRPRDNLYFAQTPQVFSPNLLRDAINSAAADGLKFTDDSSYVEYYLKKLGVECHINMVTGSYENIKITTPEDLLIAQAIVSSREY